ncbi:hypothetical protein AVEN_156748-1 [Araneus ventricosus]|uniref:Uncharacterized protein n=1 Tax=Araneus ventricosus TaxID=182803 RepID=A0A4Y2W6T1_ARAVE|nr:hypothetical protein AVEN_237447-1 [Araneus ventricosus]GBO32298.1 hypothetical protein AVEN_236810-1 [Araneus ventricosus]GBO32300.1 hypothetical protein AVEN_113211-1 [Araneus ventricosus]GBO32302.1 hypothetical protein AVEN_156748-1 [Araneus ventricosus]
MTRLTSNVSHNEFKLWSESVVECDLGPHVNNGKSDVSQPNRGYQNRRLGDSTCEACGQRNCVFEVDSNDIDELAEDHNQELTTEELMELHCVSQQEVMEDTTRYGGQFINEHMAEHSQELITEELKNLHCVSQQEGVEESLSEEEKVAAKHQSSGGIKEMLKAWGTIEASP